MTILGLTGEPGCTPFLGVRETTRMLYLIGPSAGGKTSLMKRAVEELGQEIEPHATDELAEDVRRPWGACHSFFDAIEQSADDHLHLVDIGAGAQNDCGTELADFLASRETLLVIAPAEVLYRRDRLRNERSLEGYRQIEYESRKTLYEVAERTVDTSGTEDESYREFRGLLELMI